MTNQSLTENLQNGVIRIRYPQHGMTELFVENSQRASIDGWYNAVIDLVTNWPTDQPYRVLHNAQNVFFSPYFRKRAEEVSAETVEIRGKDFKVNIAILMADNPTSHLIRLFLRRFLEKNYASWQVKLFNNHAEAITWLAEQE